MDQSNILNVKKLSFYKDFDAQKNQETEFFQKLSIEERFRFAISLIKKVYSTQIKNHSNNKKLVIKQEHEYPI